MTRLLPLGMLLGTLLLFSSLVEGTEYRSDIELTGLVEDTRIDLWGNLTVPAGERLELRNVTVVFHTGGPRPVGLRAHPDSTLILSDGDGDARTTDDMTNLTSDSAAWFFTVWNAERFEVRHAVLHHAGMEYSDPYYGTIQGIYIGAKDIHIKGLIGSKDVIGMNLLGEKVSISASDLQGVPSGLSITSSECIILDSIFTFYYFLMFDLNNLSIEDCTFKDCSIQPRRVNNTDIHGCTFEGTYVFLPFQYARLNVSDSQFKGPAAYGIYTRVNETSISNTTFYRFQYGIRVYSEQVHLDQCTFERCDYACYSWRGAIRADRIRISHCDQGLFLWGADESPRLSNISAENCSIAIYLLMCRGYGYVENGSFLNNGFALLFEGIQTIKVRSCSFMNTTYCINATVLPFLGWKLEVLDNSFEGFARAISIMGTNVSICNNTLNGRFPEVFHTAISIGGTFANTSSTIKIHDNEIKDCSYGMHLNLSMSRVLPNVQLINNSIHGSAEALNCSISNNLTIKGLTIRNCEKGVRISSIAVLTMDDIEVSSCLEGLTIFNCKKFFLDNFHASNIAHYVLWEDQVEDAIWRISEPATFDECVFKISGKIFVNASLMFRGVDFQLEGSPMEGDCGISVTGGKTLILDNTTLSGMPTAEYYLKLGWGCKLVATGSTITHCGRGDAHLEEMGLFASGSSLELSDVVMRDCHRGLVLRDSVATLDGCSISARDAGLFLLTSQLTATDSSLEGTFYGIFARESQMDLTHCLLVGKHNSIQALESEVMVNATELFGVIGALELTDTYAILNDSRITSNYTCLNLRRSNVDLWRASINSPGMGGEVLEMSRLRLYNTSSPERWFVFSGGIVEIFWSHDVSAEYRWNRSIAMGERIAAFDSVNQEPVIDFILGLNGTYERLWLLERKLAYDEDDVFGPYVFRVLGQGISGELEAPGDRPFRGLIEVIDISPPSVTIESPLEGSQLNSVMVQFSGSIDDLGSGISRVQYALDTLLWSDLPMEDDDSWKLTLEIFDGNHSIKVRAEDMDGNRMVEVTNFTIDTVPLTAAIIHPGNWTAMANRSAIVEGFVLQDEGSPLDRCAFEGDPVELNSSGYFKVTVDLRNEGPNTFVLEAYDVAGNRREISIVIVRDLTPPEMLMDDLPELTNQRELTLNGSCTDEHGAIVTLDGYHVASVENETFDVELTLEEGPNSFILAAEDPLGNRVELELRIALDTQLNGTILAPHDNAELNSTTVMLELATDPHALVRVLNHTDWTVVGANGTITLMLELEPEVEHLLVVEFRDEANNTLVQAVSVTCHEPEEPPSGEDRPAKYLLLGLLCVLAILAVAFLMLRRRSTD